jgi:hypothetical protein
LGFASPFSLIVALYLLHTVVITVLSGGTHRSVHGHLLQFIDTLSAEKHPTNNLAAALTLSTSL